MNNFEKSSVVGDFTQAVDNPQGVENIQNLMIGVLRSWDDKSKGVVQFINHKSGKIDRFTI